VPSGSRCAEPIDASAEGGAGACSCKLARRLADRQRFQNCEETWSRTIGANLLQDVVAIEHGDAAQVVCRLTEYWRIVIRHDQTSFPDAITLRRSSYEKASERSLTIFTGPPASARRVVACRIVMRWRSMTIHRASGDRTLPITTNIPRGGSSPAGSHRILSYRLRHK